MENEYLNIKEVQKEALNILKIAVEFFNKNNIKYYIFYGTLLGAVRHKGFIPWDDDIDVVIPRPEYEKLLKILKEKNNIIDNEQNIEAIGWELKNSDWPFLKFINKNIEVNEEANFDYNLWIDVFPLDGVPHKENKDFKKMCQLRKIFMARKYDIKNTNVYSKNIIKKVLKRTLYILMRVISYDKVIEKFINLCKKYNYNDCEYVSDNIGDGTANVVFEKKMFEDEIFDFEDIKVNGIKEYDKCLKILYGNYMRLPDEKDRITHGIKARKVNYEEK